MTSIRYKKPEKLTEIPDAGHVVIEASAGTGKTFTLEHLVVDLLLKDETCALENILIVTFTRRATGELRDRVRQMLTKILSAHRDQKSSAKNADPCWVVDDHAAERLRQAMLAFDQAEIYTIHSFCQKLLTENAFQNHQLFKLELVDEEALFQDCFGDVLRQDFSTDETLRGWLDAWALPEVNGKIDGLGKTLYKVYQSTGKLVRSDRYPNAHSNPVDLIAEATDPNTKSKGNRKYGWKTDILNALLPTVEAEINRRKQREGLYSYRDMLKLVEESLSRAENGDEAGRNFRDLVRAQYKYALIDEFQDTDETQWNIFRALFIDELPSDGPTHHRLFLIGDPKQAIYKFRGADVWTYVRAVKQVSTSATPLVLDINYRSTKAMVQAYNAIFKHNNALEDAFFTNETINYKNPVNYNDKAHILRRIDDKSTPAAITAMRVNEGQKKEDIAPRWLDWMATEIESILWGNGQLEVCEKDSEWQPVKASDIYVLTNSNAESHEVGRLLGSRGIPYAFYRQDGLYATPHALDIQAILQGILHPNLPAHRRAAYRSPFFAVPIRDLIAFDESLAGEKAKKQLFEWQKIAEKRQFNRLFRKILDESGILRREVLLGEGERALTNYQHIFEALGERAASGSQDLEDLIGWLSRKIDGADAEKDGDGEEDLQRLETDQPAVQVMTMHKSKGLQAEVVFIYGGFGNGGGGVTAFIDSDDPSDSDAQRVSVVSTAEGYFGTKKYPGPQKLRINQQDDWDSERLMYVAITRAKSRLYLCYAGPDAKYGRGGRHKALARSLDRLYGTTMPPETIEFVDIGPPGSHPETSKAERVSTESWQTVLKAFEDTLSDARATAEKIPWGQITASARWTTAFSSVKKYEGTHDDEQKDEASEDNAHAETGDLKDDRFADDAGASAGGTQYGSFLHNLLEDLESYADAILPEDANAWLEQDEQKVRKLFKERCIKDRVDAGLIPYSARIIFDTLRAPLQLPGFKTPASIAEISKGKKIAKEVDFHFPIPQENLKLDAWPADAPHIERGWIKGSIDLIFEHAENDTRRVFIADWKSNRVPKGDYAPAPLARFVDAHYALQARIYTLAAVKMLGIGDAKTYDERFGGCAYLFLRGMRPDAALGHGVAWCRPTWEALKSWENALIEESDTWNHPMPAFAPEIAGAN